MTMPKQQVHHKEFGLGQVLLDEGDVKTVKFLKNGNIETLPSSDLEERLSVEGMISEGILSPNLETIARTQAATIVSVNDNWGVFSRSQIKLLPHQLWVCNRTLRDWPVRMLIADDVGLGKTIEAGLILWPLISSGKVRRLLILTPAPLVEQWQERMRQMFDIRLSIYHPQLDKGKADFWNSNQQVVASLPTLRADNNDRHDRLLDASEWDLVLVDEAHHLHATEGSGKTLGFKLLEKMEEYGKINSLILFTGTPHRGKSFGFWSLMSLLNNKVFDPKKNNANQLPYLSKYMIRNLKQKVVDMKGNRLFKPIHQHPETYEYSQVEADFYQLMTDFISTGNTYASSLSQQGKGQVTLVLIALQKLASSSVAAVKSALKTRLRNILGESKQLKENINAESPELGEDVDDESKDIFERWLKESKKAHLQLMGNEIEHLEQLIIAADKVTEETRIKRILEVIDERFSNTSILIFTEYKVTQAAIINALIQQYGEDSVGFINGENQLSGVMHSDGTVATLKVRRDISADNFNNGTTRFLVSTEAAGEGIDLQENCHTLIHADLPWNPMRLHQRVGRLSRLGQKHPINVVSIRNPSTIESKIWLILEEKIHSIKVALDAAMDDSEDLMQLVLGMASPSIFTEVFSKSNEVPKDSLEKWFDEKTQTFGGEGAIQTVTDLVGNAQSFDISGLKGVPNLDLPHLECFFETMLTFNKRKLDKNSQNGYGFITPEIWRKNSISIKRRYENLIFSRDQHDVSVESMIGVGHPILDKALQQATSFNALVTVIPELKYCVFVFLINDKLTNKGGTVRSSIAAIAFDGEPILIKETELLLLLNSFQSSSEEMIESDGQKLVTLALTEKMKVSKNFIINNLAELNLPFIKPEVSCHSAFIAV